ncbi:hypothetical protein PENANT_c155G03999 [Penicillium antarcticum]|uniref:Uncharacterized protein n=1 Tax=Penicillium antarcticum TaxID=416450 RepID=A0A1V6PE47_9EURO|nr:hypothetical protein PENANT_c155G03999 [Penicillium antarcticum]
MGRVGPKLQAHAPTRSWLWARSPGTNELSNDELDTLTEVSGTAKLILDLRNEFGRRNYGD